MAQSQDRRLGQAMQLKPEWIKWMHDRLCTIRSDGYLTLPLRGLAYQVFKEEKKVLVVAAVSGTLDERIHLINCAIFNHLGFMVEITDGATKTPEQFFQYLAQIEGDNQEPMMVEDALLQKMRMLQKYEDN